MIIYCIINYSFSKYKLISQNKMARKIPQKPAWKLRFMSKIELINSEAKNTSAIFLQISANANGFLNTLKITQVLYRITDKILLKIL